MKKLLIAIFALVLLAGCEASSKDALQANDWVYYTRIMPAGAEYLEYVSPAGSGYSAGYAIIKFRGECLILRSAGHGLSMANIGCPK